MRTVERKEEGILLNGKKRTSKVRIKSQITITIVPKEITISTYDLYEFEKKRENIISSFPFSIPISVVYYFIPIKLFRFLFSRPLFFFFVFVIYSSYCSRSYCCK